MSELLFDKSRFKADPTNLSLILVGIFFDQTIQTALLETGIL